MFSKVVTSGVVEIGVLGAPAAFGRPPKPGLAG